MLTTYFLLPSLSYFSDFQMFTEAAFLIPESARKMSKSRSLQFEKAYPKCMVWSFSVTTFSPLYWCIAYFDSFRNIFFQETEKTKEFFPQKVNESQKTWLVVLKYFPFNTSYLSIALEIYGHILHCYLFLHEKWISLLKWA